MRQIALDTETTGLEAQAGHRIIEIACVEIIDRRITERHFHELLNPEREIDEDAKRVHGHSWEKLKKKPRFADICNEFLDFVAGSEVLIHNAPFDLGFLDAELQRLDRAAFATSAECTIVDTLEIARNLHAGQNSLDALSDRYQIDRSHRVLHGAAIDAKLLAQVYLAMTGGQTNLSFATTHEPHTPEVGSADVEVLPIVDLPVIAATAAEMDRHKQFMEKIRRR